MIAHLKGTIFEKHPTHLILETGGVGYDVQIPVSTYTSLGESGSNVSLRIHTHVREDAIVLFGFATREEKQLFEKLITVSGIGPKLAISVLSGLAATDLIGAIRTSDVQKLVRIPGVGKKTAERIVLELKDKMLGIDTSATIATAPTPALNPLDEDVVSALQNLGCSRAAAEEALRKAHSKGSENTFEALFRNALALVR